MASQPLTLSDPRMLAEFVRQDEFKGLFEKRFAVPPDLAALLFKNGELVDAFHGGHFSVNGLVNKLKSIVGGSTHVGMMLADLKPFSVETALRAISKDNVDIVGSVTIELQVDPEKPSNILGLMHGIDRAAGETDKKGREVRPGRKALAKEAVLERFRPHMQDRIFEAAVGRLNADELRGNRGAQDMIQADLMKEIERLAGDLGLMVRNASVEWARNAAEVEAMERAEAIRQQDQLDHHFEMVKRELDRQSEATELAVKFDLDKAKLEQASEDEIAKMALNSQIEILDAREDAKRRQELDALAHEIEVLEIERKARFQDMAATAKNELELLEIQKKQTAIQNDIAALQHKHAEAMKRSGAFNELEITTAVQKQQAEQIRRLQALEIEGEEARQKLKIRMMEAEADIDIKKGKAAASNKREEIGAFKNMTPEQIMAVNAGLSPHVAQVIAEQARAQATGNQETMAVMRDMVDAAIRNKVETVDQLTNMARMGFESNAGVAQGAGGGGGTAARISGGASASTVDCPKCDTTNEATAKFCKKCGHKLRT